VETERQRASGSRFALAAGRLITGPFAFFLAGVIDFAVFGAQMLKRRFESR
jgi:hypothetical protein